ncbi:MAG: hypothetical protein EOO50_17380, partial [Flavobacterium sp.]|uniref:hypothetical protein n=1 Tax=Flavobacterium sp. TaxID=239 RepID=UPI00120931E1
MGKILCFWIALLPILSSGQEKRYEISLKDKKDQSLAYFDFYVDKVYDKRQMRDNIGTVQTGVANTKKLADLEGGFVTSMTEYLMKVLPKRDGARKISLCFYELFVGEETNYEENEEIGIATAVVDFVEEKNGQLLTVGRFAETVKGRSADVTGKHDERIKEVLKRCFNAFNNIQGSKESQIAFNPNLPEVKASPGLPKKGVYISFADALEGTPSATEFFFSQKDERYMLFSEPARMPLAGYYGFSDGSVFYLNLGKYSGDNFFYESHAAGDKWVVQIPNRDKDLLAAIARTDRFGGIWIDAIPDQVVVLVDRYSGKVEPANDGDVRRMIAAFPDLLKEYSATDGKYEA